MWCWKPVIGDSAVSFNCLCCIAAILVMKKGERKRIVGCTISQFNAMLCLKRVVGEFAVGFDCFCDTNSMFVMKKERQKEVLGAK